MIANITSTEEIHQALMKLNCDVTSAPYGFGAFFYQHYWEVIKMDFINVIDQFLIQEWILPHYNSNTIILIPKCKESDSINQYRPIALANFNHMTIKNI